MYKLTDSGKIIYLKRDHNTLGIEFKYMDAPKLTRSMHSAVHVLELDQLWIIYPGKESYQLSEKISAYSLAAFLNMNI